MFKNYLKTAWKNLLKNKFYSIITISGLTVGMLILLWVQDELSFDKAVFAASGLIVIFIALLTTNYQSVKAALTSPVKSLRTQ